jgi:3-methyl-2-oxobutanoate hydroxymethyltransferase
MKHIQEVFNKKGKAITMVTAYDCPTAKLVEEAGIDAILVGDSVGNVILGYESTVQVTMDDILHHLKAVLRGINETPVVADMPFLSYQVSKEEALRNAGSLMRAGAGAVKLEGGGDVANIVHKLVESGIPVMGHLGLTPQSIAQLGGYKVQGKDKEKAENILEDAKALEEAGVFSIVAECIPVELAQKLTKSVSVPIIGIGAGKDCDGQVLVINDLLGLSQDFRPKFVKKYASLSDETINALKTYKSEVQEKKFPGKEHSFYSKII